MLLKFKVKNYRSIRDEAVLDMEAAGLGGQKECLLPFGRSEYLPVALIYGKNGGGKSNVIRAMWLAAQFIKNAQRTQHETAEIPVHPFELDDYSRNEPSSFDFEYECEGIWYNYGFSATKKTVVEEHLYWAPNGRKAVVFQREYQNFIFPANNERKMKELISKAVAPNQIYFSVSCTMNYGPSVNAMKWFRNKLYFSRDYDHLGKTLIDSCQNPEMLKAVVSIARIADVGISDMNFEFKNLSFSDPDEIPDDLPGEVRQEMERALADFKESLNANEENLKSAIEYNELKVTSLHSGIDQNGERKMYPLNLSDESDGTVKLMARAIAMETVLANDGVLVIDELEDRLHPVLVRYIVNRFQRNHSGSAQLIGTTHSTDLMNHDVLRRDQYYLVDKDGDTGASELYSVADFSVRNDEKIGKAYLLGKFGAIPYVREE